MYISFLMTRSYFLRDFGSNTNVPPCQYIPIGPFLISLSQKVDQCKGQHEVK